MNQEDVVPPDLLDSNSYVEKEIRDSRYELCLVCEKFFESSKTCISCSCFMPIKTWLKDAHCPLNKW